MILSTLSYSDLHGSSSDVIVFVLPDGMAPFQSSVEHLGKRLLLLALHYSENMF